MSGLVGAFVLLGAALAAGALGHVLFQRHRVSDILVLLLVGFSLGPLLGLVDASWLAPAMPVLAPLGLVIILFEGGLGLRWTELRQHGWGAVGFSLASWIASVAALYLPLRYVLGLDPLLALLFASAVGATGIVAVVPLLAQIRAPARARVWLTVETGLGDLLSAVTVSALAAYLLAGGSVGSFGVSLVARFGLGAALGLLGGLLAARLLHHVHEGAHAYPLTLGALLLASGAAEALGGSGLLAALVLGVVVGNAQALMREGGVPALASLPESSRTYQGQIIFLLRSVYFVFLGMSVGRDLLSAASLATLILLTGTLLATRLVLVTLVHRGDRPTGILLAGMMPRAMAAAVLAGLPAALGVPGTEGFVALALLVVVGSDIATTIGVYAYSRAQTARSPAAAVSARPQARP